MNFRLVNWTAKHVDYVRFIWLKLHNSFFLTPRLRTCMFVSLTWLKNISVWFVPFSKQLYLRNDRQNNLKNFHHPSTRSCFTWNLVQKLKAETILSCILNLMRRHLHQRAYLGVSFCFVPNSVGAFPIVVGRGVKSMVTGLSLADGF